MNKHSLKIVNAGLSVVLLLGLISCSDTWNSHYEIDPGITSDKSLWEKMQSNDNLSDFREILEITNVTSYNSVSEVTYAELLNLDQKFTVWAPENGTFNKDSLIELCNSGVTGERSVEKSFVRNHIARYLYSISSLTERDIMLLNRKEKHLQGFVFGNVSITTPNIVANNGILHIINGKIPYFANIYEGMSGDLELSMLVAFYKAFQADSLDEFSSVSSGIVDGKTVYVDSVLIEKNILLTELGYINNEDSSYLMIAPTNKAWEEAYQKILPYFAFSYIDQADSLQKYWTKHSIINDLTFNSNLQKSANDSLVSTKYDLKEPKQHVFYKPFAQGGILSDVKSISKSSNGLIYKVDKWPFSIQESFFHPIIVEAEQESNILDYSLSTLNLRTVPGDSISKNGYLDVVPSKSSSNPVITFQVKNTLSGKYDICVVLAPQTVYKTPITKADSLDCFRPYKFRAILYYVNEKGESKNYNCGGGTFSNNPYKMDTVCVTQGFKFPTCNFNQNEVKVSLRLQCYVLSSETTKYNREMFIDCIYLKPRED